MTYKSYEVEGTQEVPEFRLFYLNGILATDTISKTSFVTPDKYSPFHHSSSVRIIRYINHKT